MFLSEAVESTKRPHTLHESKALNMGIAELEPRQQVFCLSFKQNRINKNKIYA
jgi:hypothetical protein